MRSSQYTFNFAGVAIVLACAALGTSIDIDDLLSDDLINIINSKQSTWRAGKNYGPRKTGSLIRQTDHEDSGRRMMQRSYDPKLIARLPEQFDARKQWPHCPTLRDIRDQGTCGSCWAVGAVAAMTDRVCINSNGRHNFYFSAQDLLSCCATCGDCKGGHLLKAWKFWTEFGIVSGGDEGSDFGCRLYEIPPPPKLKERKIKFFPSCPQEATTPECKYTCRNGFNASYQSDKRYGRSAYRVYGEDNIKAEIFLHGPVEAGFIAYEDLQLYKSGVYQHLVGCEQAGHAVKILGWGVEAGTPYWLAANSWNTRWGDDGFFKILRGEDHCGIESDVVAGMPAF